jgi:hypothetical protein
MHLALLDEYRKERQQATAGVYKSVILVLRARTSVLLMERSPCMGRL